MKTIKETLANLPDEQRRQLMYAFEHDISQYVNLPQGKFIGVNVKGIKHLFISQEAGNWACGINAMNR